MQSEDPADEPPEVVFHRESEEAVTHESSEVAVVSGIPDGSQSLLGKTAEQLQHLQEEDTDIGMHI